VLPIGGVTAKIEAAAKSGISNIIIPRSNLQDVLIDDKWANKINIIPVDSLDEVLHHALVGSEDKVSLVERLANIVDTIATVKDTQPST
ncbi:MAG: S16 family serine protease, partial [Candidatus Poseidoniales archaeon]